MSHKCGWHLQWVNSVSLFQHLHRRLGFQLPPAGAGLPEDDEMRRDRPLPVSVGELNGGWVSFYLDDFDAPEIVPMELRKQMEGAMSKAHLEQRASYCRTGVKIAEDKSHQRQPTVERMGAEVDGVAGLPGTPRKKKMEIAFFLLWALQQKAIKEKVALMILGRLVRAFEFRRPLMSLLNSCWPKQGLGGTPEKKSIVRCFVQ